MDLKVLIIYCSDIGTHDPEARGTTGYGTATTSIFCVAEGTDFL